MQITVSQSALLAELALAQGAVERKTTIPVLGMVKVKTAGNFIVITSTDLEIGFKSRVPAVVEQAGEVLIPAKNLYDYISHLPDKEISIKVTDKGINLKCARSSRRMLVHGDTGSFPDLPALGKPTASIPAKALASLLTKVSFAVSVEESRFVLNAALLLLSRDSISAVATDGHRLAMATYVGLETVDKETKALVGRKCLAEIIKLAGKSQDDAMVNLYIQDDHFYFGFGDRLLYARAVSGSFPDYKRVLPTGKTQTASVVSAELRESLSRIETFADSRSKAAILSIGKSQISITSSTAESGDGEEIVDSQYKGEKIDIKLNCQYILDFLRMVDGNVEVSFKDGNNAVEMRIAGDETYRYICMPMRIETSQPRAGEV